MSRILSGMDEVRQRCDDHDHSRSEYYSHCATTVPLTDDSAKLPNTLDASSLADTAKLPNTLDASSLADTVPENANKDSKNDIEGPDIDSEHVNDSDPTHELLMDIDIDSDEDQIDTWSGGIPKTTTMATEADDHKESLHFFPNNQ
jgi:hypothetical protein